MFFVAKCNGGERSMIDFDENKNKKKQQIGRADMFAFSFHDCTFMTCGYSMSMWSVVDEEVPENPQSNMEQ